MHIIKNNGTIHESEFPKGQTIHFKSVTEYQTHALHAEKLDKLYVFFVVFFLNIAQCQSINAFVSEPWECFYILTSGLVQNEIPRIIT